MTPKGFQSEFFLGLVPHKGERKALNTLRFQHAALLCVLTAIKPL